MIFPCCKNKDELEYLRTLAVDEETKKIAKLLLKAFWEI